MTMFLQFLLLIGEFISLIFGAFLLLFMLLFNGIESSCLFALPMPFTCTSLLVLGVALFTSLLELGVALFASLLELGVALFASLLELGVALFTSLLELGVALFTSLLELGVALFTSLLIKKYDLLFDSS